MFIWYIPKHVKLMKCYFRFTSLGNTQFIENKVQDYDESIEKPDTKNESTVDVSVLIIILNIA